MSLLEAAALCARCPSLCAPACPAAIGADRPGFEPRDLMLAAATGDSLASHLCTGCGACSEACHVDVPVADLLRHRRAAQRQFGDLRAGDDNALAQPEGWLRVSGGKGLTWLVARCGCGAPGHDEAALRAALRRQGRDRVVVVSGLDCGRRAFEAGAVAAFQALGEVIAPALDHVRTLVVAGEACARSLRRHQDAQRLAALHVALLDDWLARFGVRLPGGAVRLPPCQRTPATAGSPALSPCFPAAPACCGGQGRLVEVAPAVSEAAGLDLLRRLEGRTERPLLYVADATCAAHLRQIARTHSVQVEVVDRASVWLSGCDASSDPGTVG